MRLATVSGKGGTGKTTSAAFLAAGLHRQGRTLAVDADPQGSLEAWDRAAEGLPFPVVKKASPHLHRQIKELAADFDNVVVDSPPGDEGIMRAVILSVPLVLVPVSPTGLDIDRLRPTWEMLADLEPTHPLGLAVGVVLTKVRRGTRSRIEAREVLAELGYPVMETEIPLGEMYAGAFGTMPADFGAYEDLLAELKS